MPDSTQNFSLGDAAELAAIVGALGVVAAIYQGTLSSYQGTLSRLRATLLSRQDLGRRLNRMACGVTGEYVTGLFGAPSSSGAFQG
jgi:hypothetical protein